MAEAAVTTVPLGSTGWHLWPHGVLRSAGFPASFASIGGDAALLSAAATATDPKDRLYAAEYEAASVRHLRAIRRLAADPLMREAMTWQNPSLIETCLEPLGRSTRRNSDARAKERTVTAYQQRYALKNDSISFFGPISWFRIDGDAPAMTSVPGADLVRRRSAHFEMWAIDAIAAALAEQVPERLLPVWRSTGSVLDGTMLRRPGGGTMELTEDEARAWARADGSRTAGELGGELVLSRLRQRGLLRVGFWLEFDAWPERQLAAQIRALPGDAPRERLLDQLEDLRQRKDLANGARGEAAVRGALEDLGDAFSRMTGRDASRRPGQTYAGRTIVYQEATRDVDVRIGRDVLDAMAEPLALLLQVSDWLVADIAERYRVFLATWIEGECQRSGRESLPFGYVITRLTPQLTILDGELPAMVRDAIGELQLRWNRVLPARPAEHAVTVESAALREACDREFPIGSLPPGPGICHSPDLIIDAPSVQAVLDGDFQIVLGELHIGVNSLEGRAFFEQHQSPEVLTALAEQTAGGGRTVLLPSRTSAFITSRAAPPTAAVSPQFRYLSWHDDDVASTPAGEHLRGADLVISSVCGAPVVRSERDGSEYDPINLLTDVIAGLAVNALRLQPDTEHSPRVTVDRLVIARERWVLGVDEASWSSIIDESRRYWLAQRWKTAHDLPLRVFVKVPVEMKPFAVDFSNLSSVAYLARAIQSSKHEGYSSITLTEQLPAPGDYWLTDHQDERYTSELRFAAVHAPGVKP